MTRWAVLLVALLASYSITTFAAEFPATSVADFVDGCELTTAESAPLIKRAARGDRGPLYLAFQAQAYCAGVFAAFHQSLSINRRIAPKYGHLPCLNDTITGNEFKSKTLEALAAVPQGDLISARPGNKGKITAIHIDIWLAMQQAFPCGAK